MKLLNQNKMKQTAVEWLVEQLGENQLNGLYVIDTLEDVKNVFEKAKEMEKKQIIDAHIDGFYSPPFVKSRNGEATDYYNKTFKSE